MKKVFLPIVFLLSSCNLIGNIIGERSVNNLYGLNNKVVEFALPDDLPSLKPQAFNFSFPIAVTFTFPFEDVENLNLPLGASPTSISEEIGLSPIIEVSSASSETLFPASLGIAEVSVDLTLTDGSGSPSVEKNLDATNQAFTFNKDTCTITEASTVCQYKATLDEIFFFALEFSGEDFQTLFKDVLQGGQATNQGSGVFGSTVSIGLAGLNPIPLDSTFKLVIKTRNGKVSFRE